MCSGLEIRKSILLKKLKGNKNKYKKYLEAPIRYAGGKSWAVGYVIENIPNNIKRIVSPFLGGGSIEVAIAKELNINVIAYDIFDIHVIFWQQLLKNKEELLKELKALYPNEKTYTEVKNILKKHFEKKITLTDTKLSAYYFFNHNLSYGPSFLGWRSRVYLNVDSYGKMIEKIEKFKAQKLSVNVGSFEETIPKHKNDFLYCDPPYYIGKDSNVFTGIYPNRNFPIYHKNFNHLKLKELLENHKCGFILSYNDCDTIREWYKKYKIIEIETNYSLGLGETRIGKNRTKNKQTNNKKTKELLIIKNYD